MTPLFALLTIVATVALLFAERAGSRRLIWIFKPIAALGFVLTAYAQGALAHPPGQALFAGAVLGAIGDVFLIRKEDKRWFLFGLVAFLFGHLGYVASFALRGVEAGATATAFALLLLPAALVVRWLWPRAGRLRVPVLAYILVITAMMAAAIGAVRAGATPMIALGAGMFYLSDLCVARERFVAPGFVNKLVGQPLYFGGQLVLAVWATTGFALKSA